MSRIVNSIIVGLLLLMLTLPATAEWSNDVHWGVPITDDTDAQYLPDVVEDGHGNFIVAWLGAGHEIYAQKVDADGNILWDSEGVLVDDTPWILYGLDVISDGDGGAIILFVRPPDNVFEVFAAHVNGDGYVDWGPFSIVPGEEGISDQYGFVAVPDGSGGAVVAFNDDRSPAATHVCAQRISIEGNVLWGSLGSYVCPQATAQGSPAVVPDGEGGAFVAWEDYRDGDPFDPDLYMQRLTSTGNLAWTPTGVVLCDETGYQEHMQGAPDGTGGALFCWEDNRSGDSDIYVQRVEPNSGFAWWGANGRPVCVESDEQVKPIILGDGYGGAYLAWQDGRSDSWAYIDIYVQRISPAGSPLWGESGTAAGGMDGHQGGFGDGFCMAPDGQDGIIVAWEGYEGEGAMQSDLFGQRIHPSGTPMWSLYGGHPLFLGSGDQEEPQAVAHPLYGGIVTVFLDARNHPYGENVTLMYTDHHGVPGDARPFITDVTDFPQDQGGVLIVDWERSYMDEPTDHMIADYTLWRRLAGIATRGDEVQDLAAVKRASGLCETKVADLLREGWTYVGNMDAVYHDLYSYDAPSYGDSTETETVWTSYMVIARKTDTIFWESPPAYGFSIDNLAPGAPINLAATVDEADVNLHWTPSNHHDEDLSHYLVYRGDTPDFETGPATFLGTAADTSYVDSGPGNGILYYRVTAIDVHGNEGPDSNEAMANVQVGVNDVVPTSFALRGNWPNPFNPVTRIAFDLPVAGPVRLEIFDTSGRSVATLVDGIRQAGSHEIVWNGRDASDAPLPSGIYHTRLTLPGSGGVLTSKMTLLK